MKQSILTKAIFIAWLFCLFGCTNSEDIVDRRSEETIDGTTFVSGKDHEANVFGKEVAGLDSNPGKRPDDELLGPSLGYADVKLMIYPSDRKVFINTGVEYELEVRVFSSEDLASEDKELKENGKAPTEEIRVVLNLDGNDETNATLDIAGRTPIENSPLEEEISTTRRLVIKVPAGGKTTFMLSTGTSFSATKPTYYLNAWARDGQLNGESAVNVRTPPRLKEDGKGCINMEGGQCKKGVKDENNMSPPSAMWEMMPKEENTEDSGEKTNDSGSGKELQLALLEASQKNIFIQEDLLLSVKLIDGSSCSAENARKCRGNFKDEIICWSLVGKYEDTIVKEIKIKDVNKDLKDVITTEEEKNANDEVIRFRSGGCQTLDSDGKLTVRINVGNTFDARYFLNFFHPSASPVTYTIDTYVMPITLGEEGKKLGASMDGSGVPTPELKIDSGLLDPEANWLGVEETKNLLDCAHNKTAQEQPFCRDSALLEAILSSCYTDPDCKDDYCVSDPTKNEFSCQMYNNQDGSWSIQDSKGNVIQHDMDGDGVPDPINIVIDVDEDGNVYYTGIDIDGDGVPDIMPDPCIYDKKQKCFIDDNKDFIDNGKTVTEYLCKSSTGETSIVRSPELCKGKIIDTIISVMDDSRGTYSILCSSTRNGDYTSTCSKVQSRISRNLPFFVKVVKNIEGCYYKDGSCYALLTTSEASSIVLNADLISAQEPKLSAYFIKNSDKDEIVPASSGNSVKIELRNGGKGTQYLNTGTAYKALYQVKVKTEDAKTVAIPIFVTNNNVIPTNPGDAADPDLIIIPPEMPKNPLPNLGYVTLTHVSKNTILSPVVSTIRLSLHATNEKNNQTLDVPNTPIYWSLTKGPSPNNNGSINEKVTETNSKGISSNLFYVGTGYGSIYYVRAFHPNYLAEDYTPIPLTFKVVVYDSDGSIDDADSDSCVLTDENGNSLPETACDKPNTNSSTSDKSCCTPVKKVNGYYIQVNDIKDCEDEEGNPSSPACGCYECNDYAESCTNPNSTKKYGVCLPSDEYENIGDDDDNTPDGDYPEGGLCEDDNDKDCYVLYYAGENEFFVFKDTKITLYGVAYYRDKDGNEYVPQRFKLKGLVDPKESGTKLQNQSIPVDDTLPVPDKNSDSDYNFSFVVKSGPKDGKVDVKVYHPNIHNGAEPVYVTYSLDVTNVMPAVRTNRFKLTSNAEAVRKFFEDTNNKDAAAPFDTIKYYVMNQHVFTNGCYFEFTRNAQTNCVDFGKEMDDTDPNQTFYDDERHLKHCGVEGKEGEFVDSITAMKSDYPFTIYAIAYKKDAPVGYACEKDVNFPKGKEKFYTCDVDATMLCEDLRNYSSCKEETDIPKSPEENKCYKKLWENEKEISFKLQPADIKIAQNYRTHTLIDLSQAFMENSILSCKDKNDKSAGCFLHKVSSGFKSLMDPEQNKNLRTLLLDGGPEFSGLYDFFLLSNENRPKDLRDAACLKLFGCKDKENIVTMNNCGQDKEVCFKTKAAKEESKQNSLYCSNPSTKCCSELEKGCITKKEIETGEETGKTGCIIDHVMEYNCSKSKCFCAKLDYFYKTQFGSIVKKIVRVIIDILVESILSTDKLANAMCDFMDSLQYIEFLGDLRFKDPEKSLEGQLMFNGLKFPYYNLEVYLPKMPIISGKWQSASREGKFLSFSSLKLTFSYGQLIYTLVGRVLEEILGVKAINEIGVVEISQIIPCASMFGTGPDVSIPGDDSGGDAPTYEPSLLETLCSTVLDTVSSEVLDYASLKNININLNLNGSAKLKYIPENYDPKKDFYYEELADGDWTGSVGMSGKTAKVSGVWIAYSSDGNSSSFFDAKVNDASPEYFSKFKKEHSICRAALSSKSIINNDKKEEGSGSGEGESDENTNSFKSNKDCLNGNYDYSVARERNSCDIAICNVDKKHFFVCKDKKINESINGGYAYTIIRLANAICAVDGSSFCDSSEIIRKGDGYSNDFCLKNPREDICADNANIFTVDKGENDSQYRALSDTEADQELIENTCENDINGDGKYTTADIDSVCTSKFVNKSCAKKCDDPKCVMNLDWTNSTSDCKLDEKIVEAVCNDVFKDNSKIDECINKASNKLVVSCSLDKCKALPNVNAEMVSCSSETNSCFIPENGCKEGFANKDKNIENGCEACASDDKRLLNDKCVDLDYCESTGTECAALPHLIASFKCANHHCELSGNPKCEDGWKTKNINDYSEGCLICDDGYTPEFIEGSTTIKNCTPADDCINQEDCYNLKHINKNTISCVELKCEIDSKDGCEEGWANKDGKASTGCEACANSEMDPDKDCKKCIESGLVNYKGQCVASCPEDTTEKDGECVKKQPSPSPT